MYYTEILTLLCPDAEPIEEGYLYARFSVVDKDGLPIVEEAPDVYYCANGYIASQILVNQIKPNLTLNTAYFVIFPISESVEIAGANTAISQTISVVHFGLYDSYKSQSIARENTTKLLEYYHNTQRRYISSIRINNTTFENWSEDNSVLQQYTTVVNVNAIQPYLLSTPCK